MFSFFSISWFCFFAPHDLSPAAPSYPPLCLSLSPSLPLSLPFLLSPSLCVNQGTESFIFFIAFDPFHLCVCVCVCTRYVKKLVPMPECRDLEFRIKP